MVLDLLQTLDWTRALALLVEMGVETYNLGYAGPLDSEVDPFQDEEVSYSSWSHNEHLQPFLFHASHRQTYAFDACLPVDNL